MRNYKHYKLYLIHPKGRWLSTSLEVFPRLMGKLRNDDNFMTRASLANPITYEVMTWWNPHKLTDKYVHIIRAIVKHFECMGLWVYQLGPDGPHTSIEIWGYPEDVELCTNVINYYVNGCMMVEENLTYEYRRQKLNARRTGKTLEYNTRTLVKLRLELYLLKLNKVISDTPLLNAPDKKLKLKNIFKEILRLRKLDKKGYMGINPSIGSYKAPKNQIHIKRLV